jgi:hypothetical protein
MTTTEIKFKFVFEKHFCEKYYQYISLIKIKNLVKSI